MSSTRAIQRYHSGSIPFAVDIFLDTYEGPGWVRQKLRGKSGWIQLSRASMETPMSTWHATLIAARTDDGEALGLQASSAFLSMRSSSPRELDQLPPEELDVQSDMLFWDFLGRCDLRHLQMLREAEAEAAERVTNEQAGGEQVVADADAYIANLRRQRRALDSADERRIQLANTIRFFEDKQSAAVAWLVQRLAGIREGVAALENDVLAALEHHGEIEELHTLRWTARHSADRVYSRERPDSFFLGPNPPRRDNLTAEARLARDRLFDDEGADDRRSRLAALREEWGREWARRLMERERSEIEKRLRRRAADVEFAHWHAQQKSDSRQQRDWRLTVEEANDLSATVREMQRAAHDKVGAGETARPETSVQVTASQSPCDGDDRSGRAALEGANNQPKSDIDEFHAWMKDVGLV
jgi:hypothetical protein